MRGDPSSLEHHRVRSGAAFFESGKVRYAPVKSAWFTCMALGAVIGGALTFSWAALALFFVTTGIVLLFGHSLGSHRKLIHDSFACPRWLEYVLVYLGVQVGLSGPLGLLRQHELRDYAQRLPDCHDYLRHGSSFWKDAYWQLHCNLEFLDPPVIRIEERIVRDRFYRFLERTWMAQQLPWAILFYLAGGWGFVFWGVCARVAAGVSGHWLVGYFAHNHGDMHVEVRGAAVQGRNIRLTSLLTMGECWHNNHHAFPGSARLGLLPGEWDPGWWALMLLRRCGIVWNIRTPDQLPPRQELVFLHAEWPPLPQMTVAAPGGVLLFRALVFGSRTSTPELAVRWPGSILPRKVLSVLCGPDVTLVPDRGAPRMTLRSPSGELVGLPAALAAIGRRHAILGVFTLLMLPAGLLVEKVRAAATL